MLGVPHFVVEAEENQVVVRQAQQLLQRIGFDIIIGITEQDVFAAGHIQPFIPGGGRTGIFLVKHPDARILIGKPAAYLEGSIG